MSNGSAFLRLPAFRAAGTKTLTVTYKGSPGLAASTSTFPVEVVRR